MRDGFLLILMASWLGCSGIVEDDGATRFGALGSHKAEVDLRYDASAEGAGSPSSSPRQRLDGSYPAHACNKSSGKCQDVSADLRDGFIEELSFAGGGRLELDGAELLDDGSANGDGYTDEEGYTGDVWSVTISRLESN